MQDGPPGRAEHQIVCRALHVCQRGGDAKQVGEGRSSGEAYGRAEEGDESGENRRGEDPRESLGSFSGISG
jgi:hypothetical protein